MQTENLVDIIVTIFCTINIISAEWAVMLKIANNTIKKNSQKKKSKKQILILKIWIIMYHERNNMNTDSRCIFLTAVALFWLTEFCFTTLVQ